MDLKAAHCYLVSEAKFRERTKHLVRELNAKRRRRFLAILRADPMPPLEDIPIGKPIRFVEVRR